MVIGQPPHKDYYEGILQLRNCDAEVLDFVESYLHKKKVHITKQKKVKNGNDIFIADQHSMQALGKKLSETFSGESKTSKKLFTRSHQTGKEVYRVTVLFRQLPFKRGDIVDYKGSKVKIVKIGNKITGKDIKTGKNMFIEAKQI